MKNICFFLLFSPISFVFAQIEIRKINIDIISIHNQLLNCPNENIIGIGKIQNSTTIISLPFPDGSYADFKMVEYSILPKGTKIEIKTFYGQKIDDNSINCRITLTKNELNAIIYTKNGIVVLEKSKKSINFNEYDVYIQTQKEFEYKTENSININPRLNSIEGVLGYTNGANLRTYRMAIIVTDEFYIERGNTDATINAQVISIVNNLNGLYEKEVATRFTLVSPNNPVSSNIFYRKMSDINTYYQNVDIIKDEMNNRYDAVNYDLGHCLHTTGGGYAYSGVCDPSYKGGGWSGSTTPASFLLMAHEVGHQFFAQHTFLGNGNANCSVANRNLVTAFEPGSGNTIMSYAGVCGSGQNITGGKVPYFHTNTLDMITYIQSVVGCGTSTVTGNTPPVAVAGTAFTIPKNTPFTLIGSGSDANNDVLSFTWEEYDSPVANDVGALGSSTNGVGGYSAANSMTAPLFKSKQSSLPIRTLPSLNFILNNNNNPEDTEGEDLPNVARVMNFILTARDNRASGGGINCSSVVVTVDNSGPFLITSQNFTTLWLVGKSANISWSVNGTNTAPINCLNVKISFSTDGGTTFPIVLAASTPNDGSHTITIPNNLTTQGRIKIEPATSGVFFDINDVNITVTNTCTPETSNITPTTAVSATVGDVSLNLGLSSYGTSISNFTGTLTISSPTSNLSFENPSGVCAGPSNGNYYAVHSFQVVTAGTYTFTRTGSGLVMNLYSATFNPSSVCSNWLASSAKQNTTGGPVSTSSSLTKSLTPGIYYIVIETFSTSSPVLPSTYTITPSGGSIFNISPAAGSPYSYIYLTKNNTSGNVTSFTTTADLSNATNYPAGSYTVYGLSYQGGLDLLSYIGTSFATFQSLLTANTVCGKLSDNSKSVTITPNCANSLSLSGITTNGIQQANQTITSTQVINSGQNVTYRAGNSIMLTPLTASGFSAASGSVFKAEIGGCN